MTAVAAPDSLRWALLALRLTLGLFLLQWGIEKFVMPDSAVAIWGYFYGVSITRTLGYLFGAVEIALALCLFLGVFRTIAYGMAMALHAVSVVVSWPVLIRPWADPASHLFIAGVPVLGAFVALFLLRRFDRGLLFETREQTR
jgi:putative oxidoreductase